MAKVHNLDVLAQRLYERLQRYALAGQERLAGPTAVGTRKLSTREMARKLLEMSPEEMQRLMAQTPAGRQLFSTAFDQLGPHALALLPYLQPGALLPEPEVGEGEMFGEVMP